MSRVGFPSNEYVERAFAKLGRPDAFVAYKESAIGMGTTARGSHVYGTAHSRNDTALLGAESVARGWLANRSEWELAFTPEYYPKPKRKIFLEFVPGKQDSDSYLHNAAKLWNDPKSLSISPEIRSAMRFVFAGNNKDGLKEWTKCATRHNLSPQDVVNAVMKTSISKGAYNESLIALANAVSKAERDGGVTLRPVDFAAWMFATGIFRNQSEGGNTPVDATVADAIARGVEPGAFTRMHQKGLPLEVIATALENNIDADLMTSIGS